MSSELVEKGDEPRHSVSSKHDAQAEFEKRQGNIVAALDGHDVNASGHEDQLKRHFGLWSLIGLALTVDNAWVAFGGSIIIASYNGGPPGMLYELIVAVFYYLFIGASLSELASALPTAGGVYHWASVTPGPKYGRMLGFFTGFINFFGWIFDLASICQITSNVVVQMYAVYHPDLVIESWHTYVVYVILTWTCSSYCIFFNRTLPNLQKIGMFFVIVGGFITIVCLAALPKQHASNAFVWKDWDNQTGWISGVAFLTGVMNGAFTVGTPDSITHIAEELPNPRTDLPKAIMLQISLGGLSAFLFAIALLYGIIDFDAVLNSNGSFPLAEAYAQATGTKGGTFGLLFIVFISILICLIGTFLTLSRIWWALARDLATPFPHFFSKVDERLSCPIPAMVFTAVLCTGIGAITLGSKTAFSNLAGSFIILTSTSYVMAILPHLLTGRKNVPPGPFWMGKAGAFVQGAACLLIIFFNIMFCFPFALPATAPTMNYNSVILVGCFAVTGFWWLIYGQRKYPGPKLAGLYLEGVESKAS